MDMETKNASVQKPLSMDPSPFPLSSRAKPRDLQFTQPQTNPPGTNPYLLPPAVGLVPYLRTARSTIEYSN
jgi:hypothetical protein